LAIRPADYNPEPVSGVVGLSGVIGNRWAWRRGWQSHRFGNDENSTQQFFIGAGYRFER
jgi:hypothetical protein